MKSRFVEKQLIVVSCQLFSHGMLSNVVLRLFFASVSQALHNVENGAKSLPHFVLFVSQSLRDGFWETTQTTKTIYSCQLYLLVGFDFRIIFRIFAKFFINDYGLDSYSRLWLPIHPAYSAEGEGT